MSFKIIDEIKDGIYATDGDRHYLAVRKGDGSLVWGDFVSGLPVDQEDNARLSTTYHAERALNGHGALFHDRANPPDGMWELYVWARAL